MGKRLLCFILFFLIVLNLTGCSMEKSDSSYIQAEFTDKEWMFYDEVTAEHFNLFLGSDGTFCYYCDCGEPVGDSDVYDKYEYDSESRIITLSNSYDDETKEIEVIDYNEYHLMVKIDGEFKDFSLIEMDASANFFAFEGESYLEGYESRCTIVDMKDGQIVYGPVNYDPEGTYEDGPFEEYAMAETVPVFDLTIKRYLSIQDDQEYEEFYNVSFTEIGQEDIEFILDSGAGLAFVWFDDELKVEKIVFYGELSVSGDYEDIEMDDE